ncbi:MAG TPA: DUF6580 family putative transport protein [Candidatus Saccharimonadales bacterium]|nr:DUF6580 family putative transport protein [Candidatus Saccharimonadales bacterium]
MRQRTLQLGIACALIAVAVCLRLLPHPANFAPVAAIALFGGTVLPRYIAPWVPLGAMATSDLFLGFYDIISITWACYVLIALASSQWLQRPTVRRVGVMTLLASLFFFVATNFAVWAAGTMYTHDLAGLVQCYELALPFFRGTLVSDLVYTASLFGLYALAIQLPARKNFVTERSI